MSSQSDSFFIKLCSQWGDSFFVTLQLVVIIMQILYYSPNSVYVCLILASLTVINVLQVHLPLLLLLLGCFLRCLRYVHDDGIIPR